MADKTPPPLPLESDDPNEQALWQQLGDIELDDPSPQLRREFYRRLEAASRPGPLTRLRDTLGLASGVGWLTAAACLVAGLTFGSLLGGADAPEDARLAALEQNVALLNRSLILDRLTNESPGKRLRGVLDAAYASGEDSEITRALLERATADRVPAVRAAAIDALGTRLTDDGLGNELMRLLEQSASPIVQLALVDLVLRRGSDRQRSELLLLAEEERLYPDLSRHVRTTLKGDSA